MSIDERRSFIPINIAVLTISDTRTANEDKSGDILVERLIADGHTLVSRDLVKDDLETIVAKLEDWLKVPNIDVIITTGGTGITGRDVTPEAMERVSEKPIEGFGELFRWISYQKIGTSTIQSRACAVVSNGKYLFSLPGSPGACKDGWDEILHYQLNNQFRPCNFVELIPRLKE